MVQLLLQGEDLQQYSHIVLNSDVQGPALGRSRAGPSPTWAGPSRALKHGLRRPRARLVPQAEPGRAVEPRPSGLNGRNVKQLQYMIV